MSEFDSIVITGGGGMLAHALHDLLAARGHAPVSLTRAECDVANPQHIERIFEKPPTLFLNCAAHTKVDLCEEQRELADEINGYAVGRIAAQCARHGTRLVHVSTDFVFDGTLRRPYLPDDPVHAVQAYGQSKLLGETELMKAMADNWLIVRTAWVYGRHGASFPRTMVSAARAGKPLAVVADQLGSPTYTNDLADGILSLLDHGARGIWHVTNSGQTSWLEFARAALEAFGLFNEIKPLSSEDWRKIKPNSAVRPPYTVLDTSAYAELTGRTMRPWREGLKDFAAAAARDGF